MMVNLFLVVLKIFSLEDNCFTVFYWFLPYINMNQPKVYICPPWTSHFTIPPTSVQFSSVAQSCPTVCDPMDCSRPGLPVHHQLPEFTQIHVCWVGDAIQPSHPLSSPFPPTFSLSQHQGLFQWVSSSHQVAKVWSISFSINLLGLTGWISLQSKGLSRVFSNNTIQ